MTTHPLRSHFDGMARYGEWATRRLLDQLSGLPEADYRADVGLFFRSIHGTLNHLLVAEHGLWFVRFAEGTSPRLRLDQELEPDRGVLAARLLDGVARWRPWLAGLPDERLDGRIDYRGTDGQARSLPFSPTLAHVFNHGTHHRGQISAALTALGHPAPELDLVWMLQAESRPA